MCLRGTCSSSGKPHAIGCYSDATLRLNLVAILRIKLLQNNTILHGFQPVSIY